MDKKFVIGRGRDGQEVCYKEEEDEKMGGEIERKKKEMDEKFVIKMDEKFVIRKRKMRKWEKIERKKKEMDEKFVIRKRKTGWRKRPCLKGKDTNMYGM